MRMSTVTIHNFRSIRHLTFGLDGAVTLLGPNNHGKSNVLSAIEFALTTGTKPTGETFFALRPEDDPMWVDIAFTGLTSQEQTTFRRYLQADGGFCIRKTARLLSRDTVETAYNGYVEEPVESWLQADSVRLLAERAEIAKTPLVALVPPTGRLTQAIVQAAQEQYIAGERANLKFRRTLETSPMLGQKNVAGGVLPEFFMVPAVRDLADETKIKNTTVFGRLLSRAVREMADRDPRFKELRDRLASVVQSLNRSPEGPDERPEQLVALEETIREELHHWGVGVEIEVVPPVIEKIFELGTNLQLDDGVRTLAEQKGHGLQRAVIFALIRAWASVLRSSASNSASTSARAASESVIFAIEEPELFLHPHAQRKLARSIGQIAATPHHQVLVCSHSTHFVNLDHYKGICIVSKPSAQVGTVVRQCNTDLFEEPTDGDRKRRFHMGHWLNPDRGEMFFAKRAVFVEGETEKVVLPYLAEALGCLDNEVSIIDCGAKHNLPLYIAIANAFGIPYTVVHDEDPVPDSVPGSMTQEVFQGKIRTFKLNEEIRQRIDSTVGRVCVLSPDFEGAVGVSRRRGDKVGKALAALEFFSETPMDQIPETVRRAVKLAFCERADQCTTEDCRVCAQAPALALV